LGYDGSALGNGAPATAPAEEGWLIDDPGVIGWMHTGGTFYAGAVGNGTQELHLGLPALTTDHAQMRISYRLQPQ
jgi:hypothetical protein